MPDILSDDLPYDDLPYDVYQELRRRQLLGFLPGVVAVAPAAGPAAPLVIAGGVIVSAIAGLFKIFGGDDQATSYRPPRKRRRKEHLRGFGLA